MGRANKTEQQSTVKPGVCFPWEEWRKGMDQIQGDELILRKVWEDIDTLGYIYIWQCLLSF
jgi:hypothetical protein